MKDSKKQKAPSGKQPQGTGKPETAGPPGNNGVTSKIWDDARFAHLINDPRYRGMPKSKKKVQIDNRFKAMFEDGRFNERATVDKYGRKLRQTQSDELKKFYELAESDEDDEKERRERELEERAMEGRLAEGKAEASGESGSEADSEDNGLQLNEEEKKMAVPKKVKERLKDLEVDYARGEGVLLTDSSSDDESDEGEGSGDEVFIEHVWGELDADAERTEDSTRRLAVCHMDWDRIRAVDIMVLLKSFLPPGATINSVTIYPSEFGKERMKEEEERGPQELTKRTAEDSEEEDERDEEAQKETLREYQLNRLKYYYAVVECDTVQTADKIYRECDGVEYESTANKMDLRFVPDEMEFDDEPKDHCTELPDMSKYEPRIFRTSALTQAKVELTWDENDPDRDEFNEKIREGKWAQMPESELKKYVVCSSSDEADDAEGGRGKAKRPIVLVRPPEDSDGGSDDGSDSDGEPKGERRKEDMIAKYKALLNDVKEQTKRDDKVEMEFTWKVDGDGKQGAGSADDDDDEEDEEEDAVNARSAGGRGRSKSLADDVNPFEKILQKKKEKSKRRKELKKRRKRGELGGSDGEANGDGDDSSDDDTPYGVDLNDPFFASAFDENEFDVGGKRSSKKKDREAKKQQAREQEERDAAEEARRKAELELLLDDGQDSRAHFNLRAIQESELDLKAVSKSKRRRILKKSKQQIEEQRNAKVATDDFEVDVEDTRFGAIFSKADYNIDPTNPAFKKTKAMERLIEHKLKKRQLAENDVREEPAAGAEQSTKKAKKDVATTMLVKSIKRKISKTT